MALMRSSASSLLTCAHAFLTNRVLGQYTPHPRGRLEGSQLNVKNAVAAAAANDGNKTHVLELELESLQACFHADTAA